MRARLWIALTVVALGAVAYASGAAELVAEPARLRALLAEAGPCGPLAYLLAFSLIQPLGAPGVAFVGLAALAWPPCLAFGLAWAGSVGAGTVGFSLARGVGRPWIEPRLPARFRTFDERLATRGLWTVVVLRLLFFLSSPAHWALGLSRVRLVHFLVGSALGFLPGVLLITFGGAKAWAWVRAQPPATWVVLAASATMVAAAVALRRRCARR